MKQGTTTCQHGVPTDSFMTTGRPCELCDPPFLAPAKSVDLSKLEIAVAALKDFAENGTGYENHPIGGGNWQNYIRTYDRAVRDRAKEALKKLGI